MKLGESPHDQKALIAILKGVIPGETPDDLDIDGVDWAALVQMAAATKTQFLLLHGLETNKIAAPKSVIAELSQLRRLCLHENMASIASNIRISRILQTNGIESLSVKGVLRSHEVYGRWDMRSAADIDLLVRREDYRQAGEVLVANGYWAPVPSSSDWWHHYLGESPFLPDTATGPTVDLHHKLDQPGTPAIENSEELFKASVARAFGLHELRVLDPCAALMLTATNFGKALRQHEPCLRTLHEIAYLRASLPEPSDDRLDEYARENDVYRLWEHARNAADCLFRPSTGQGSVADIEGVLEDLIKHTWPQRLMHRTRLLWNWTDGNAKRPVRFLREFARVRAAMISHSAYEQHSKSG